MVRFSCFIGLFLCLLPSAFFVPANAVSAGAPPQALSEYVVIGWNDLGMHCMNQNYQSLCILPPYNTMWAQAIRRGNSPQLMSQGVSVSYRFPNNTSSANRVNFWTYSEKLFGVKLAPDSGLTGSKLNGALSWNGTAFEVTGVPLTPFEDTAPTVEQPYQIAVLTLSGTTGQQLDQTEIVAPVSVEIHCDKCHGEEGRSSEDDILNEHESVNGKKLSAMTPVLCASCHESNALGTSKKPGIPSLSQAVHGKHAEEAREEGLKVGCYDCHPGQKTQCHRDVMYSAGLRCENCHGTLEQVASSIKSGRRPWMDEPRCDQCHSSVYAENAGKLYRQSTGHGGLYCTACHNSPHAILPSIEPRDNAQAIRLQGVAGTLKDCRICHVTVPTAPGPHGLMAEIPVPVMDWPSL